MSTTTTPTCAVCPAAAPNLHAHAAGRPVCAACWNLWIRSGEWGRAAHYVEAGRDDLARIAAQDWLERMRCQRLYADLGTPLPHGPTEVVSPSAVFVFEDEAAIRAMWAEHNNAATDGEATL